MGYALLYHVALISNIYETFTARVL